MRTALATAAAAGVLALAPLTAVPAHAAPVGTAVGVHATTQNGTDVDEPLAKDGNDDTGKYGLAGLAGLLGLFGYKKYRDHRAGTTAAAGGRIGTVDGDGSGSTRI